MEARCHGGTAYSQGGITVLVDLAHVRVALPGYEFGEQLGAGSYSVVVAAVDRLGRDVAVKVMREVGDRAETEAQILHRLRHPHIVEVLDYVPAGEFALIVMERAGGGSLRARLRADPVVTPEWACGTALAVASALEFAHGHNVLHRDVKPGNLLFTTAGRPKLSDFGIAKALHGTSTLPSEVIGTPLYMAPEQFLGMTGLRDSRLRHATDVYALGVLTYELLAGATPAPRQGSFEDLRRFHLELAPPPLVTVPEQVGAVVLRALAKPPEDRYQTARAFALALAGAAAAAYGSGWLARSGSDLVLAREVEAAADRPSRKPVPVANRPRPRVVASPARRPSPGPDESRPAARPPAASQHSTPAAGPWATPAAPPAAPVRPRDAPAPQRAYSAAGDLATPAETTIAANRTARPAETAMAANPAAPRAGTARVGGGPSPEATSVAGARNDGGRVGGAREDGGREERPGGFRLRDGDPRRGRRAALAVTGLTLTVAAVTLLIALLLT
jgi:serine/threonine protein kinase